MATIAPIPQQPLSRRALLVETWLVLGVSLGASAVWAVLSLIRKLTAAEALSSQTTSMNSSVTPDRPWLDLAYQLATISLALVPAALALHLLRRDGESPLKAIGLDHSRPLRDLALGLALAAVIGIPGLGLYAAARAIGVNTTVAAANLDSTWWTVPVLILAAAQNAILEQVIMVGYLFRRWTQVGWSTTRIVLSSAVIRGTYHIYQGFGAFAGNVAMGAIFGWIYARTRRLGPLIVAHTVLDIVAFVGYAMLRDRLSWL